METRLRGGFYIELVRLMLTERVNAGDIHE